MVNEYFENFFSTIRISNDSANTAALLLSIDKRNSSTNDTLKEKILLNIKKNNPYLYEVFLTEIEYVGSSNEVFYWVTMYYNARIIASLTEKYKVPFVQAEIINAFYEEEINHADYIFRITPNKKKRDFRNTRMKEMFYDMYKDRKNSNILDGFWNLIISDEQGMATPWIRPFFNLVLLMHRQQKLDISIS
jgi:hypothetical protein